MNKKTLAILIAVLVVLAGAVTGVILIKKNQDRTAQKELADTLIKDTLPVISKDTVPTIDTIPAKKDAVQSKPRVSGRDTALVNPEPPADPISRATATGRPVLVDFGRGTCIPCKKMAPILAELKEEYAGRAEVLVLDIDEYPGLTRECEVQMIPTQIFYDTSGSEVHRHVGFMKKQAIVDKLEEMGVN